MRLPAENSNHWPRNLEDAICCRLVQGSRQHLCQLRISADAQSHGKSWRYESDRTLVIVSFAANPLRLVVSKNAIWYSSTWELKTFSEKKQEIMGLRHLKEMKWIKQGKRNEKWDARKANYKRKLRMRNSNMKIRTLEYVNIITTIDHQWFNFCSQTCCRRIKIIQIHSPKEIFITENMVSPPTSTYQSSRSLDVVVLHIFATNSGNNILTLWNYFIIIHYIS